MRSPFVKTMCICKVFIKCIYSQVNRNVTLFQWKIHGVLFKAIDGDNESSSFQEMLMNSTKQCLK